MDHCFRYYCALQNKDQTNCEQMPLDRTIMNSTPVIICAGELNQKVEKNLLLSVAS